MKFGEPSSAAVTKMMIEINTGAIESNVSFGSYADREASQTGRIKEKQKKAAINRSTAGSGSTTSKGAEYYNLKKGKRGENLYKSRHLHSDPESVYDDKDHKIQKIKEQILNMGSNLYEKIILSMKMRPRTLINYLDARDVITEDDIVLICLREDCLDQKPNGCRGQLLEPKLKKSLMNVPLNKEDASLGGRPKCAHCGTPIHVPNLRITLGNTKRTFREDKDSLHREIQVKFLSAL